MPICMRAELNKTVEPPDIKDDEVVFFCQPTGEIFRDYEEYIDRIMLVNSTIWACGVTGTKNLTFIEAKESEKAARKKLEKHMEKLKAPILMLIEHAKQTHMRDLLDILYQFLKNRYFVGETVCITKTSRPFKILEIIKPSTVPANGVYDPSTIRYKIQNMKRLNDIHIEDPARLKRRKSQFSYEILKYFVKEYTIYVENVIKPKEDLYKSIVLDKKITFESIFIGKMPKYEPGKNISHKKAQINGKQMSLESYLVKNKNVTGQTAKNILPKGKALVEEMERIRIEKQRKQEELDRIRAERILKIEKEVTNILTKRDDLEREDQKLLPVYAPVKTLIPCKFFGDMLMIQEFLNSFLPHLAAYDVFKGTKVSFPIMCRAYNVREVAGPLGDMLQVLLSSIFSLQIEEEQECRVEYVECRQGDDEPWKSSSNACKAHKFVKTYFSHKLHDLPIDVQTLSEVLRLHLLSSGAPTDERSERWRYQYRNGYNKFEDPGLLLRLNYPHILRALKLYTIYQLPFSDIIKVLQCLVDQVLTYSGTVALVEERHEKAAKARFDLRILIATENKRVNSVHESQKQARIDHNLALMECKDNEEQKAELEKELEKKLERITHQNEIDKNKFNAELEKIKSIMFDHMIYIGSDRAYRNYYILESLEGVFIEHPPESGDICLSNPPINSPELAQCTHERRALRTFMSTHMQMTDKENVANNTVSLKEKNEMKPVVQVKKEEILENGDVKKINGTAAPLKNGIVKTNPNQYDLFMCTGDSQNCIVHDARNKDRVRWSYLYTEEDFNALINALNPFGIRESELKEKLVNLKALIFEHIKNCPTSMLTLGDEPEAREKAMEFVMNETQKKYNKTNFGLPIDTDLNEVMFETLVEQILQLEEDVRSGNLGKLNVNDIEKWRNDVNSDSYESQVKDLSYGFEEKIDFRDPGEDLGDTLNIESEDSGDEAVSPYDSPTLRKRVTNVSSALLQIAQGIDKKFLQEPFGRKPKRKKEDKKEIEKSLIQLERNFKHWEISLMNSSSFSQVFLHLNILHDAIMWYKSSNRSRCIVCKKGTDAEKMLLCDECNAGTHMYCMKPKLKAVPEGNWYCTKCKQDEPKKKSPVKKKVFSMDDDANDALPDDNSKEEEYSNDGKRKLRAKNVKQRNITEFIGFGTEDEGSENDESESSDDAKEDENGSESQTEEASVSEEEEVCKQCGFGEVEITCMHCKVGAHLECVGLRRFPRSGWICSEKCKPKETQKRRARRLSSSSDDDEPLVKKQRRLVKKTETTEDVNKNNTSRRSRRNYDCPLDSVILYDLLDEITKHKDSWPFLRPVSLFEVPDYHEIIKRPMDFARVKSNLNIGVYRNNEEFLQDVQLIFSNCDAYNAVGNDVYQAGVSLEKYIAKRCEELNLPFTTSDMIAESEMEQS